MKGLLLKDWYMTKKYCRYYLFVGIGFIILSFMSKGNMFFIFYPCLLCGMIPVHLLGYDERSRFTEYVGTLPYTKIQIVSAKYLIGLFIQIAMLTVICITQGVKMSIEGNFVLKEFLVLMMLLLIMASVASSLTLPFVFKYGVEKGRGAYYVMIGVVCAGSIIATTIFKNGMQNEMQLNGVLPIACLIGVGIYVLSWYLSIVFYKKKEI
ncbi:MAG: ABC-2 transporter permease [Clostridia bacterium]|nr:ABC-2 transporter permease [Clostridia bacterium]MBP3554734.1 ABC-2 transporter permease [Clostridia bacterium]